MRVAFAAALAVGLTLAVPGCSRTGARVSSGIELYEKGAYEGALLRFRDVGSEESSLRAKTRARYLAYRGLAHWHMARASSAGKQAEHREEARRFLAEAQAAFAETGADPKWLPADVREELAKASAELGLVSKAPLEGAEPIGASPAPASDPTGGPSAPPVPTPAPPATGEPVAPAQTSEPAPAAPPLAPIPSAAMPSPAEPL